MDTYKDLFCYDLTTTPIPGYKVLVSGATGYIGGELIPELLARGYHVRVLVRNLSTEYQHMWPGVDIIKADALKYKKIKKALKGIDCAFYLIHSLHLGKNKFLDIDNQAALNFRKAADENKLKRIIYLGGLGDPKDNLSAHLRSRFMVGEVLQKGKTPVTFLRAAVIVGSGSSSYKIINRLIRNCPVFVFPKKANAMCQPIAIRDIIKYLVGSLETEETSGNTYDLGGADVLSYLQMLKVQAKVMGKKRFFIPTSFSLMPIYARIGSLITPVPYLLVKALMESCINDVVCQENQIRKLIPFEPMGFEEALTRAFHRKSQRSLFIDKEKQEVKVIDEKLKNHILKPPSPSNNIFSDLYKFLVRKPAISTLIRFNTPEERENYSYRIMQRLEVAVKEFKILNIHKIGVNAPTKYVFEELLKWDGDSTCWPNYIAHVDRTKNTLESLYIYLLGWKKLPVWLQSVFPIFKYKPLFKLNAIKIKELPDPSSSDNERYLLYRCSGGYPIGIFSMYVRSSIAEQNEKEQSQLFLIVGFNFYGKKNWSDRKFINKIWESIHDRVTANVLNRIKQLSEWRFEKIKSG